MNKKKILVVVMTCLMLVSLLGGCQSKKKQEEVATPTTSKKETSEDSSESSKQQELVPLKVYTFTGKKQKDEAKVLKAINTYLKEKINADVEIVMLEVNDYKTKVPLLLSAGDTVDLCFASGWANPFLSGVSTNAFLPLEDLLESHGSALKEFIPSALWGGASIDGSIYGVPMYKEMGRQYGFYVNKELADKYGFDLSTIKRWDDIEPMLKVLKEKEPDVVGLSNPADAIATLPYTAMSGNFRRPGAINPRADIQPYSDQGTDTVFNQYATKEYEAAVNKVHAWYKAGYTPEDVINFNKDKNDEKAAKENKLFSRLIWYAPNAEKQWSSRTGHEYVYIPLHNPIIESDVAVGNVWTIPYTSKNPEKAMELMTLLYTDKELGTMIRHGIEGVHYNKKSEDTITVADGIDATNRPYDQDMGWMYGTIFNQYIDVSQTSADTFDTYYAYNDSAVTSDAMGYIFDTEPVLNELGAIDNVLEQYRVALSAGMVDPAKYLPEFLKALENAGVERVMKETQKQYDSWKKNK